MMGLSLKNNQSRKKIKVSPYIGEKVTKVRLRLRLQQLSKTHFSD